MAYGILNDYGEFWTTETFMTEAAAHQYIKNWELKYQMLPNHTVIPVIIKPLISPMKGK